MLLRQQLGIVLARLPLLIASVALAGASAFFFSTLQPKVYQSEATLIVGQSLTAVNPDFNQLLVSQRLSETYATIATTRPVLQKVIDRVGLEDTPEELAERVSAESDPNSALLKVSAQDGNPGLAATIANTLAEELIAATPSVEGSPTDITQSIDEDLAAIQKDIVDAQAEIASLTGLDTRTAAQEARLDTLRGRVISLRSTYATLLSFSPGTSSNLMTIIQPAFPDDIPIAPRPLLTALLAAVVAFMVTSAAVFVVEYLDDAIKSPEQVESVLKLPTLGAVERMGGDGGRAAMYRLATLLYPRSGAAESYRTLRTNIEFASVDKPIRKLLVTSALPSEGKTVTAANIAVAFAQGGRRVLLIDADLRKAGVHEIFSLANDQGLTDLLRSDEVRLRSLVRPTEQKNLDVLTAGPHPPNPAELLASHRMRSLLPTLTEGYDLVIFDSPPLNVFSDAAVLSSFLDGTVLVVESRRGRLGKIQNARDALAKANADVLGVVLNGLSAKAPAEYGRYYGVRTDGAGGGQFAGAGSGSDAGSASGVDG